MSRNADKVAWTETVRGSEFFLGIERVLCESFDFVCNSTFLECAGPYPDIFYFGLMEKIINMPEEFFLFFQMPSYPLRKPILSPSHIKIGTRREGCLREFSCSDFLLLL